MNSAFVQWKEPEFKGGTQLCGYHIRYREYGSTCWTNSTTGIVLGCSFLVSGLKKSYFYEIQVAAENKVGISDWSESSDLIEAIRKIIFNMFFFLLQQHFMTLEIEIA